MSVEPLPLDLEDVLRQAAEVLEVNGWFRGDFYDTDWPGSSYEAPVCALGAIRVAAGEPPAFDNVVAKDAAAWLAEHVDPTAVDCTDVAAVAGLVGFWNDAPERTVDEVLTALREAADQAVTVWTRMSRTRCERTVAGVVWALEYRAWDEIGPGDPSAGWYLRGPGEFAAGQFAAVAVHRAWRSADRAITAHSSR